MNFLTSSDPVQPQTQPQNHRRVILTRFIAHVLYTPYSQTENKNYFSILFNFISRYQHLYILSILDFFWWKNRVISTQQETFSESLLKSFCTYLKTADIRFCLESSRYLVCFISCIKVSKNSPQKSENEALDPFIMYDSCVSNYLAWKIFLPYFPPIWCIFAAIYNLYLFSLNNSKSKLWTHHFQILTHR